MSNASTVAYEVGIPVDGLAQLDQGLGAVLAQQGDFSMGPLKIVLRLPEVNIYDHEYDGDHQPPEPQVGVPFLLFSRGQTQH